MVGRRRGEVGGLVVAALVPLLFGFVVAGAFGPGWFKAYVLATYLVYVPFILAKRRHVDWLIGRRLGLFVLFCCLAYCWTVLVFAVAALLALEGHSHWSAWRCLGISVLISALATGALWPMQLRYYANLRASRGVKAGGLRRRG